MTVNRYIKFGNNSIMVTICWWAKCKLTRTIIGESVITMSKMLSLVAVIRVGSSINWNKLLQLRKCARSMPHLVEDWWSLGLKFALI